jgi:hypothetical protein
MRTMTSSLTLAAFQNRQRGGSKPYIVREKSHCKKVNIIANVHLTYTLLKTANGVFIGKNGRKMAEGEGFEPYSLLLFPRFPDTLEVNQK